MMMMMMMIIIMMMMMMMMMKTICDVINRSRIKGGNDNVDRAEQARLHRSRVQSRSVSLTCGNNQ